MDKLQAQMDAQRTVAMQESYLGFIVSLHRDAGPYWDWARIAEASAPSPTRSREIAASAALQAFKPTFFDKLLSRVAIKRQPYEAAVSNAREEDQAENSDRYSEWEWLGKVGAAIVARDLNAYRTVIERFAPFGELEEVGAAVYTDIKEPWYIHARVRAKNSSVIPSEELKLLASGKVSAKEMQKAKYWAYYQDYICSAAIRTAREMFHLLPVAKVYVDVSVVMLDKSTGHDNDSVIVSVEFEREPTLGLNFDRIDASDAIERMRHEMDFKKTTGFTPVSAIAPMASITSTG